MSANLPTLNIKNNLSERLRAVPAGGQGRDTRTLLLLATLITFLLTFVPYGQYLLYPVRLFTTFVHESGHAFATLLVGGGVASLAVHPDTSGLTQSVDVSIWWRWLMYSAGYLGATVFGALMLQVGRVRTWKNAGRNTLYATAAALLIITLLWGRDLFTLATGVGISVLLLGLARHTSPRTAEFIAAFLAVQCSLNALFDIRTLLFLTTNMPGSDNDAKFMQNTYLLPAAFWAFLWAIIAVVILGFSLRAYWRATRQN